MRPVAVIGAVLLLILCTPAAEAADQVFWAGYGGVPEAISFANLDGSGGGDLNTMGATVSEPLGMAIDAAAGRVYWANDAAPKISFANLDGSGGGDLNTTGATTNPLAGIAVYPAAGKVYWGNYNPSSISFAKLDGSGGGGDLSISGATVEGPSGVAIDPGAGRIYWSNDSPANKISFANLDSSGGGDLNTGEATVDRPFGVAIDPVRGRIYWANFNASKISFANLDGSGGGDLSISGATVEGPIGVAIDPGAGRIYWANSAGDNIAFANLDGGGGGELVTAGATTDGPAFPVLLQVPSGAGAPAVTGGSAPGSTLSCSSDSWKGDQLGSFLYRSPQSLSYRWSREGADIPGAASPAFAAGSVGSYRCLVTAQNHAGSSSQTSAPLGVFRVGKPKLNRRRGIGRLPVTAPQAGLLTLRGNGVVRRRLRHGGQVKLPVKARGKRLRKLRRSGFVRVKVRVTFTPDGGTPGSQARRFRLRKIRHR